MQDLLLDIKEFLEAKGEKTTIFRDAIDDKTDKAIVLYEYQGNNPGAQIAGSTRPVQFVVRDKTATGAKDLIRLLYKMLETEDSIIQFTSNRWAIIHLSQPPFKLKVDEKNRTYYVFNTVITTYNE